ncbi:hypothetical protein GPJ56_007054 [Histomonas meleagridis]|uniref:uncharacterized protein n=1 Tax=Histomonas meleagridis TaxID=135588 RepID=UPI003559EBB6|nr:hypothetical protein GPJ56_007054 [Histomonas meleagridis]KAH0801709.1 hypothetical protein GO595_005544 [Histomonas meleagridis]
MSRATPNNYSSAIRGVHDRNFLAMQNTKTEMLKSSLQSRFNEVMSSISSHRSDLPPTKPKKISETKENNPIKETQNSKFILHSGIFHASPRRERTIFSAFHRISEIISNPSFDENSNSQNTEYTKEKENSNSIASHTSSSGSFTSEIINKPKVDDNFEKAQIIKPINISTQKRDTTADSSIENPTIDNSDISISSSSSKESIKQTNNKEEIKTEKQIIESKDESSSYNLDEVSNEKYEIEQINNDKDKHSETSSIKDDIFEFSSENNEIDKSAEKYLSEKENIVQSDNKINVETGDKEDLIKFDDENKTDEKNNNISDKEDLIKFNSENETNIKTEESGDNISDKEDLIKFDSENETNIKTDESGDVIIDKDDFIETSSSKEEVVINKSSDEEIDKTSETAIEKDKQSATNSEEGEIFEFNSESNKAISSDNDFIKIDDEDENNSSISDKDENEQNNKIILKIDKDKTVNSKDESDNEKDEQNNEIILKIDKNIKDGETLIGEGEFIIETNNTKEEEEVININLSLSFDDINEISSIEVNQEEMIISSDSAVVCASDVSDDIDIIELNQSDSKKDFIDSEVLSSSKKYQFVATSLEFSDESSSESDESEQSQTEKIEKLKNFEEIEKIDTENPQQIEEKEIKTENLLQDEENKQTETENLSKVEENKEEKINSLKIEENIETETENLLKIDENEEIEMKDPFEKLIAKYEKIETEIDDTDTFIEGLKNSTIVIDEENDNFGNNNILQGIEFKIPDKWDLLADVFKISDQITKMLLKEVVKYKK